MAQPTKGPWLAAAAPSSIFGWPVVSPDGRSICSVTWRPREHFIDVTDAEWYAFNAECRANAHLIAAAHDLKAALREMIESDAAIVSFVRRPRSLLGVSWEREHAALCERKDRATAAAKAAIAKAEAGA